MNGKPRTITNVTVTVTFDLPFLETFGPGSLFDQARSAAAIRLGEILDVEVSPEHVQIESISTDDGAGSSSKFEAIRS